MTAALDLVGVVVVTHNSSRDIGAALAALPAEELYGIAVVDNASTDGTPDLVASLEIAGLRLLREPNSGFGAGCNAGIDALPLARWILLLNPDAVLTPDDLRILVSYALRHPDAALVAPRLWQGGKPLTSAGRVASLATELRYVVPSRLAGLLPDRQLPADRESSGPVGAVEGACMLVDATLLRSIGGFDEQFFLFFEEHDLARRIRDAGRTVHVCSQARADHAVGASREGLSVAGRDHYFESTIRYLRKWGRPGSAAILRGVATATWSWQVRTGRMTRPEATLLRDAVRRGAASR